MAANGGLKAGLSAALVFVGGKMLVADFFKVPALVSLAVIVGILGGAALASWRKDRQVASSAPAAQRSPA